MISASAAAVERIRLGLSETYPSLSPVGLTPQAGHMISECRRSGAALKFEWPGRAALRSRGLWRPPACPRATGSSAPPCARWLGARIVSARRAARGAAPPPTARRSRGPRGAAGLHVPRGRGSGACARSRAGRGSPPPRRARWRAPGGGWSLSARLHARCAGSCPGGRWARPRPSSRPARRTRSQRPCPPAQSQRRGRGRPCARARQPQSPR
mmetsp:Transcript_2698/g.8864  ORF Transcript_2698/g.8864 Transcript_2698/m.8864 type:complete len:212 (-) Transcript_2698:526-1161(-)